MKNLFVTTMLAGAIALWSPSGALANGVGGHAHVSRDAGHYRYYPRFGFGFAYDPFWYGPGWAYPYYGYPYVVPAEATGGLRLEVTPKTAQVYVDGAYAGVVDDFNGHFQHLDLAPGGHRIEVRQPGFQPLTFETYIQANHTTGFKGALTPDAVR